MSSSILIRQWSPNFVSKFDNFIFDCDGVLWRGSEVISGIPEMLKSLQSQGKNIILCSNNASKLREKYVDILAKHNIEIPLSNVYTSAYTAAAYISNLSLMDFDPVKHKVLVCGTPTLTSELASRGIKSVSVHDILQNSSPQIHEHDLVSRAIQHTLDPLIRVVVAGLDPKMNYASIGLVSRYLREVPKSGKYKDLQRIFISTNIDTTYPAAENVLMPGAGSACAMLQAASGRKPIIMGKPEPYMLDAIINDFGWNRERTLMIGDRCDTDIEFANLGGISSMLVLSGVTSLTTLESTLHTQASEINKVGESEEKFSRDIISLRILTQCDIDESVEDNISPFHFIPNFIAPSASWITNNRESEVDCTPTEKQIHMALNTKFVKNSI